MKGKICKISLIPICRHNIKFGDLVLVGHKLKIVSNKDIIDPDVQKKGVPVHMYFISDDEIKNDDWFLHINQNRIFQATKVREDAIETKKAPLDTFPHSEYLKKVVASTNSALALPMIMPSFLKDYIAANGNIAAVLLRTINVGNFKSGEFVATGEQLSLSMKNEVIISKIYESTAMYQISGGELISKNGVFHTTPVKINSNSIGPLLNVSHPIIWKKIDFLNDSICGKVILSSANNQDVAEFNNPWTSNIKQQGYTHYILVSDLLSLPRE